MISCEIDLLGVYLGFGGNSKKTGYNVYGFDEYMNTAMFKVGANLKLGLKTRNEFIVLPYLGFIPPLPIVTLVRPLQPLKA